jgi:hypothetical protein
MTFPKRDVRAIPAYTLDFWTDAARIRKPLQTTTPHLTTPHPPTLSHPILALSLVAGALELDHV